MNITELFEQRALSDELFFSEKFISDGNIAIKRKYLPNLEIYSDECAKVNIEEFISQKGKFISYFEIKIEYPNAIYLLASNYSLLPIDNTIDEHVDSRWLNAVDSEFIIDTIKVYEHFGYIKHQKHKGSILEIIGWGSQDDYNAGYEPSIIGYIAGIVNKEEQ